MSPSLLFIWFRVGFYFGFFFFFFFFKKIILSFPFNFWVDHVLIVTNTLIGWIRANINNLI
jgi:hypothetical protein